MNQQEAIQWLVDNEGAATGTTDVSPAVAVTLPAPELVAGSEDGTDSEVKNAVNLGLKFIRFKSHNSPLDYKASSRKISRQ